MCCWRRKTFLQDFLEILKLQNTLWSWKNDYCHNNHLSQKGYFYFSTYLFIKVELQISIQYHCTLLFSIKCEKSFLCLCTCAVDKIMKIGLIYEIWVVFSHINIHLNLYTKVWRNHLFIFSPELLGKRYFPWSVFPFFQNGELNIIYNWRIKLYWFLINKVTTT